MYRFRCLLMLGVMLVVLSADAYAEVAQTRSTPTIIKDGLQEIAAANADVMTIEEFGSDNLGNNLVWITLGAGENVHTRPALLLVAGAEPMDVTGPDVLSGIVSSFLVGRSLNNDRILDSVTVYVVPYLSASSLEMLYASPRTQVFGALHPHDEDRDGLLDEDGGNDMDGDKRIMWLREKASDGAFVEHHLEPALMVPYESSKQGQRYNVYLEGTDEDEDGRLNEDVAGAINLNTNSPHAYPAYQDYAGAWSMTSPELRLFTDKLFGRPNIIAAYVLGTYDNVQSDWKLIAKRNPRGANILSTDSTAYAQIRSELSEKTPYVHAGQPSGDLGSWLAYGCGPVTLMSPAYVYPALPQDSSLESTKDAQVLATRWLRHYNKDAFQEWKAIDHEFFAKSVELGGVDAWEMVNAPADSLQAVTEKHYTFVRDLCDHMPKLQVETRVTGLGADLFRISVSIHNDGTLPSHTVVGNRVKMHKSLVLQMTPASGMMLLEGLQKTVDASPITGKTQRTYEWVVKGTGSVDLMVMSPSFGSSTETIEVVKEGR